MTTLSPSSGTGRSRVALSPADAPDVAALPAGVVLLSCSSLFDGIGTLLQMQYGRFRLMTRIDRLRTSAVVCLSRQLADSNYFSVGWRALRSQGIIEISDLPLISDTS